MELPKTVKLNCRINPRWAEKLNAAGINKFERTQEQDKALRARQATESVAVAGKDPFRGERKDATGTVRPDSGQPVFGWKQEGRQSVTLRHLFADVEGNLRMVLVNANTMQKEGDHMSSLRLTFAPEGTPVELSVAAQRLVAELLRRTFGHLHCFRNPDGSLTVNPSHIEEKPDAAEIRDFRISADGSIRCEKRS